MTTVYRLDDIADAMEQQSESLIPHLDTRTGQIILLGEEELRAADEGEDLSDYPEWERQQIETAQLVDAWRNRCASTMERFELFED